MERWKDFTSWAHPDRQGLCASGHFDIYLNLERGAMWEACFDLVRCWSGVTVCPGVAHNLNKYQIKQTQTGPGVHGSVSSIYRPSCMSVNRAALESTFVRITVTDVRELGWISGTWHIPKS